MTAFYARIKGLHQSVKVKEIKKYLAPIRPLDVKILKNGCGRIVFKTEQDFKTVFKKTGKIHGKDVNIVAWPKKSQETKNGVEEPAKPVWPVKAVDELKTAILDSGRLFVRNLSYECTEEQLEELFSQFGSLSDIHLSYDSINHSSKGFAFVTYVFPADAVTAFTKLDKTKFKGRLLHILPAEDAPESQASKDKSSTAPSDSGTDTNRSSFQLTRQETLKATAGVSHNWNALFIRPDAVATYLAAKFGLTKEQVLNPTERGGSVAVRLAHAEAQLVTELRDFLQKQGLDLDAFDRQASEGSNLTVTSQGRRDRLEAQSSATARQLSGTAFLIKNLPVGTTEVEIRELIRRHTNPRARAESDPRDPLRPKRVIVPPLGITAIVVFALPQHARLAYRLLAYEPFQDSVLYLQWLPHGVLKTDANATETEEQAYETQKKAVEKGKRKRKCDRTADADAMNEKTTDAAANAEAEFELITSLPEEDSSGETPAKKHRGWSTSDVDNSGEEDVEHADVSAKLSKSSDRAHSKKTEKPKVKNYENKKARLRRQETQADEVTDPVVTESVKESSPETQKSSAMEHRTEEFKPTKPILLVRNVSFQATQDELMELFRPIGGLLRVRLPQKPVGGHRGFCFVEFNTIDQAKAAKQTLGTDTHFLGRRLQIEFARG